MSKFIRIMPCGDFGKVQGTRVVLPSGEHIPGVTKIVLIGNAEDHWRAEIHCLAEPPRIAALDQAQFDIIHPPLWRRIWNLIRFGYWWRMPK